MCDREAIYKLSLKMADMSRPKDERNEYYKEIVRIAQNPTKVKDLGFDQFWEIYPHKVSKGYAEKAFPKALKETTLETILRGVEFYKRNKDDKTPWAYPASWLNAKRWNDGQYIKPVPKVNDWPEWKVRLSARLGEIVIDAWFKEVEFAQGIFTVPNKFTYDWIKQRYSIDIKNVFGEYELRMK